MINKNKMLSSIEGMQRTVEKSVLEDVSFHEALQYLKRELDENPLVQSALSELRSVGCRVFCSFTPRFHIRIKTAEGIVALPKQTDDSASPTDERVTRITQELKK